MQLRRVSSSPVSSNHPPDDKDGGNDSDHNNGCCSCTHQDQHEPLSLQKDMRQLLESIPKKLDTIN